ncbi:hypothetical protein K493DRAFT_36967 [Basidiobolus meristosporus CBS 931.73]|uniref:Uncharacterized protein n=1 Tax=Basidiobolus meristosporus CBS 931.73 TaxID=1314790 RepID=A0A1Y1Z6S7_9FUNG|nr:hypothetical protein K493DRAFT_36967 [Basidiobolus meristosporus CBS 931.73]|eukprot:ORY05515.1 hypothetical protein K493DRAFT_36967 [Basidiobolus meristosporus CBS 931.73]
MQKPTSHILSAFFNTSRTSLLKLSIVPPTIFLIPFVIAVYSLCVGFVISVFFASYFLTGYDLLARIYNENLSDYSTLWKEWIKRKGEENGVEFEKDILNTIWSLALQCLRVVRDYIRSEEPVASS